MNRNQFKRRIYIIDPEFQYGLIRKISFLAVLMIIMSLSFLLIVYHLYGDIRIELVQPDPFAALKGIKTIEEPRTLLRLLWPVLGICVIVTLAVTFIYGLLISHRMAGPIFRIKKVLSDMSGGALRGEVNLRRGDDFKSLAEEINQLKKSWRDNIQEMETICGKIRSDDETKREDALEALMTRLSTFKTK